MYYLFIFHLKYFVFQGFISYEMASTESGVVRIGSVGVLRKKIGPLTKWRFMKLFTSGFVRNETCDIITVIR